MPELSPDMYAAPKSAPARILFAIPSMVLGGSERVMLNLLYHIDAERFEPHVMVLERGGAWLQNVPPHVRIHELGVWRSRRAVFPFARLCRHLRPQAVLSTSAHLNAALVAARPLLPMGTSLLAREGADLTSPHANCGPLRLFIYKHVYRRADLVICQSDYMMENLIRQFGLERNKVVRIYNPVDIDSIAVLAELEPKPFSDPGPHLVAVGRFSHEKGFDLLLRCTPLVRQAFPSASVTLVGDGPDFSALKAAQRELSLESCVRFVGLRRNPYPFLKHADLVVLPSRSEALPNVVLEAIALGTAVVATNCTPALSEISSCTQRMRVAKDTTPAALAAEIICALANIARSKARPEPQFEARFGIRAVIRQYEGVLWHSILARSANQYANASGAIT
jgi:glycosyltransferase involved in cell wall biosynthesis